MSTLSAPHLVKEMELSRTGISDLVEHPADVWVLDPLPFGDAAKGIIVSAPNAITNRHAQDTA